MSVYPEIDALVEQGWERNDEDEPDDVWLYEYAFDLHICETEGGWLWEYYTADDMYDEETDDDKEDPEPSHSGVAPTVDMAVRFLEQITGPMPGGSKSFESSLRAIFTGPDSKTGSAKYVQGEGGWQTYVYKEDNEQWHNLPCTTPDAVTALLNELQPGNNWTFGEGGPGDAEAGVWLVNFNDPELDAQIEDQGYYGLDNEGTGGIEIETP